MIDRQRIETLVLSVLATVLKCEVTLDSSRKNTPQWDSLKHIQVIFAIEDELGLQFPEAVLGELNSVRQIVDKVLAHYEA